MNAISWSHYGIFVLTSCASVIIPGPAILHLATTSASLGVKRAIPVCLGLFAGSVCFGLMALLLSCGYLHVALKWFKIIQLIGGLALILLGCTKIMTTKNLKPKKFEYSLKQKTRPLLTGFLITLSNPKIIAVYLILIPGFVDSHYPLLPQILLLLATQLILKALSLFSYTLLSAYAFKFLLKEKLLLLIQRIIGSLFIIAGCFTLLQSTS